MSEVHHSHENPSHHHDGQPAGYHAESSHSSPAADIPANGQGGNTTTPSKKKTREVENILMKDQRTVEFVGNRRLLKESFLPKTDEFGNVTPATVRLDFRNGETLYFAIPDSLLFQFALHGAEQKLGDETAGTEDVDDMVLDVEKLIKRLNTGEWSTQREGGMSGTSVLLKALVELTGKTVEEMKAFLEKKTPKEKLALRASPKIKPTIDRLEAEKAAKSAHVDTDALLSEAGIA